MVVFRNTLSRRVELLYGYQARWAAKMLRASAYELTHRPADVLATARAEFLALEIPSNMTTVTPEI